MDNAVSDEGQVKIVTEALVLVSLILELYRKVLERDVPWKEFKNLTIELPHYTPEYSKDSAELIGKFRTQLENINDDYFATSQTIHEWCDLSNRMLTVYAKKLDDSNSTVGGQILSAVLDDSDDNIRAAQATLAEMSTYFGNLHEIMYTLLLQLECDFDESSKFFERYVKILENVAAGGKSKSIEWFTGKSANREEIIAELKQRLVLVKQFHLDLQRKIGEASAVIQDARSKIESQIPQIGVQKANVEKLSPNLKFNAESREIIKNAIKNVTDECRGYLRRQ